jgi:hypothetical protein
VQDWDDSWIDTAYTIVRKEYDRSYDLARSDLGPNNGDSNHDSNHDYVAVGSIGFLSSFYLCYDLLSDALPQQSTSSSDNIFDNLPGLAPASQEPHDELDQYLSTDTEDVKDAILWWHERRATFPHLSHCTRLSETVKFYQDSQ